MKRQSTIEDKKIKVLEQRAKDEMEKMLKFPS